MGGWVETKNGRVAIRAIYKPVGPGLQIFCLITLPFAISYAFWGELKSLRGQSVGEDSAGLQLANRLQSWTKLLRKLYTGKHFSKHRSCTGSSLSPFPWKQCCCVFKRKPDPWAFVGSNIELGEGVFFPQRRRFGNSFVAKESGHDGENFLK